MNDETKFAWAYLLLYGDVTDGEWEFYGSGYKRKSETWDWQKLQDERKALRDKVTSIGIDWNKTEPPTVSDESCFTDTFSDPNDKRATLGTLYLKNGERFLIGSGDNEAASLADAARQLQQQDNELMKLAEKL